MKKVKITWDALLRVLPTIWGMIWMFTITLGSLALAIQSVKWLLSALGVI